MLGQVSDLEYLPLPAPGGWEDPTQFAKPSTQRKPLRYIMPDSKAGTSLAEPPTQLRLLPTDLRTVTANAPLVYQGWLADATFKRAAPPANDWDAVTMNGLLRRVNYVIDASGAGAASDGNGGGKAITALLNQRVLAPIRTPIDGYAFDQPGIYLIRGLKPRETLTIDKPILLKTSGIVIVESGSIKLSGVDADEKLPGCGLAKHLFSVIALDGDIRIGSGIAPYQPVHAYLAALADKAGAAGGGRGGGVRRRSGLGTQGRLELLPGPLRLGNAGAAEQDDG